jgi:hypothetical protein
MEYRSWVYFFNLASADLHFVMRQYAPINTFLSIAFIEVVKLKGFVSWRRTVAQRQAFTCKTP